MDMKKTAKKIAAVIAGSAMLGATIMGATAQDLSNYPAPFVTNGVFNGKIVVGEKAATSDVVGAIDLAASLQAQSTTTTQINVPGAAGTATVIGDNAQFKTGSDILGIGESLKDVKDVFTANDLDALKAGVIDTGIGGSTPVKQYLRFENATMNVVYEEDTDNDVVGDFLKVTSDTVLFEYRLEFSEGAESDVDSNSLEDLEDEVVTMLGAPFTITSATVNVAGDDITLEMLGGQVAEVLRDGETKTFNIDGKEYEVTALFISDAGAGSVKLEVNGQTTKELEDGETEVLGGDTTIGIQSILTNNREGLVEFYLGANKLTMTDTNYSNDVISDEFSVEVREETIDEEEGAIAVTESSATRLVLDSIRYQVSATDDYYVPAGKGLRSFLEDNEFAMLTDTWDVVYAGLMKTGESEIEFAPVSDHSYNLEFENIEGVKYTLPLATNDDDVFNYGDTDDDFIFQESDNASVFPIGDNDYFIVTDTAEDYTDDDAIVNVYRYQSISESDHKITFRDLAGSDVTEDYDETTGLGEFQDSSGATHAFDVDVADTTNPRVRIDLDADGNIAGNDEVFAVTRGGALIDFGAQTPVNAEAQTELAAAIVMNITTAADAFDEGAAESTLVEINETAGAEIDIEVTESWASDFVADPENDDVERGYSNYGAFFQLVSDDNGADRLTIGYPLSQRGAQVFVTAGTVEVQAGTETAGGALSSTKVNPISGTLAVLDTEAPALGSTPLIVVGGPCVNTVAAELMGNPAECAEGFQAGKAIIKLYSTQNALLVAGFDAQDTVGATYVLKDAADYKLSGTEVEVVTADLESLTVNKVQ